MYLCEKRFKKVILISLRIPLALKTQIKSDKNGFGMDIIDFNKLKALYKFSKDLSFKEVQLLIKSTKTSSLKKRNILIEAGSTETRVYFIRKGLIRQYHVNEEGEEITFRLIPEQNIVVNADYLLNDEPCRFYFETLEDTSFLSADYEVIQNIISNNPKLEKNRKFVFRKMIRQAKDRIESFVLLSPEKRYLKFIKDHPGLTNRVQDKYIANVLGITPVSLSRIRKRIASRK